MTKLDPTPPAPSFLRNRISRGLFAFTLGQQQRCPFCHDHLHEGEALVACSACRAVYHRECLGAEGECLTYGCPHGSTEPRRSSLRDRWSRGEPWSRCKKAVALGLMLTGLALAWLFVHPPHPHPIPGPFPHRPHVEPPLSLQVVEPWQGAVFEEGERVWVRGHVRLRDADRHHQQPVAQVRVWVDERPVGAAQHTGGSFEVPLTLTRGSHVVRVTATEELNTRSKTFTVYVRGKRAPSSVSMVRPELDLAGTVRGSEVMVRGRLRGNGPVDVTIRGGGQSLTYQAQAPGPFATVITLPHVGTHAIQVSVRDAQGRVRTASGNVRRLR